MKVIFCAHQNDELACLAVRGLIAVPRIFVEDTESAPVGSVAVFSANPWKSHWPGRTCRMAAHRIENVPAWAQTTPFRVALRANAHPLEAALAVREAAGMYLNWFNLSPKEQTELPPWGQCPTNERTHGQAFLAWQKEALEALLFLYRKQAEDYQRWLRACLAE